MIVSSSLRTTPLRATPSRATVDDVGLLRAIAERDQDAFFVLYQSYCNLVFSLALRVVHSQPLAEEVTQDVFLKIWQRPDRWDPTLGQFSSWLLTITRNAAIDRLRKEQRHWHSSQMENETQRPQTQTGAISDDPLWFEGQVLMQLLNDLPDEQRELLELAFYQGYTHSELADGLQLPLGTVKTRLRSGLQKLRVAWERLYSNQTPSD